MAYGTVKVDTIIFDQGGADQNVTVSGIYRAITSGVTVSGTISGAVLVGTTTVSGTTVTGTTANFASGVFTTQVSGATVTGTQSSFTSGNFVTLSGATATFTSGVIASGTAAAPALSIVGDLNTGIYSPGADQVAVATNGVARVVVNNTGLGVGIPPSRSIDVYRGDAGQAILRLSDVDSRNVELRSPDGTGNQGSIGTVSNHDFIGLTGNTERLRITSAGLVGVGTSSPADKLHVVTSGGKSAILIGDTTADTYSQVLMYGGSTKYNWSIGAQFNVNNALEITPSTATEGTSFTTPVAVFTQAGLVGIGTSAPNYQLHVTTDFAVGASGFNQQLTFSNDTIQSLLLGTGYTALKLNPLGGNVGIGSATALAYKLNIYESGTGMINALHLGSGGGIAGNGTSISFGLGNGFDPTANILAKIGGIYTGGGYDGALTFSTCSNTSQGVNPPERMRITSAGNVGIGTTSPGSALEINAAAATSPFIAKINTAEAARIDSSGRLLVGNSSTTSVAGFDGALQLQGTGFNGASAVLTNVAADNTGSYLLLGKARGGTLGGYTSVNNGDNLGQIRFLGADGTGYVDAAYVGVTCNGVPGTNNMPGRLFFSTNSGTSSVTERMCITPAGLVGIGTSSPGKTLDVTGTARVSSVLTMGSYIQGTTQLDLYGDSTSSSGVRLDSSGRLGIGTTSPTTLLDVNADTIRVRTARTPASASATGATGEICWDANYIYVCTATNTWKRSTIATW